jgi:hypothetical protein
VKVPKEDAARSLFPGKDAQSRKTNSKGAPKRAENTPAKMLSSTSALPSRIK